MRRKTCEGKQLRIIGDKIVGTKKRRRKMKGHRGKIKCMRGEIRCEGESEGLRKN